MLNLSKLQSSTRESPPKILVYGPPKVGKTTFLASVPGVIIVQNEDGSNNITCARCPSTVDQNQFVPVDFNDYRAMLTAIRDEPHEFTALAIDTLDGLEGLIHRHVCTEAGNVPLEKVEGGYGRGYTRAIEFWREILALLESIQTKRHMTIVMAAHTMVGSQANPTGEDYAVLQPALHKRSWPLVHGWCDAILLATEDFAVDKKRSKQVVTGRRILRAQPGAGHMSGNRYGFPQEMPLNYANGWAEIQKYLDAPKRIRAEVEEKLAKEPTERRQRLLRWLAEVGSNATELEARKQAIFQKLSEEKGQ
jgi:hypothetical protein